MQDVQGKDNNGNKILIMWLIICFRSNLVNKEIKITLLCFLFFNIPFSHQNAPHSIFLLFILIHSSERRKKYLLIQF